MSSSQQSAVKGWDEPPHQDVSKASVPGKTPARPKDDERPQWSNLQETSSTSWCTSLLAEVLRSRTAFSEFLKTTLHADRAAYVASGKALFPLPIPQMGLFEKVGRCGSRERRKRAMSRAFHIMVMALNYWHADFKFVPLHVLRAIPSENQRELLSNMKKLLKAFGSCPEKVSIPGSGRRSATLVSLLADLSDFLCWEGLSGDTYRKGFVGAGDGLAEVASIPATSHRAEELVPYRPLDPGRLKITGTASWNPSNFLDDAMWLAFQEPASLLWTSELPAADFPDLSKEKRSSVLQLAKIWDAKNLLRFAPCPENATWKSHGCIRFFNCYKSSECDRMIGDRRLRNWREGRLPGVSRALPNAQLLSHLEIDPKHQVFSICISDRRDFYHQFEISAPRTASNALWPPLEWKEVADLKAAKIFEEELQSLKKTGYKRSLHGDELDGVKKPSKKDAALPDLVLPLFNSIPQGDHLGVEFATCAHRGFLQSKGLLCPSVELRADVPFRGLCEVQGLVIDDFYAISVEACQGGSSKQATSATSRMKTAVKAYGDAGILGSADKDVWNEKKAKVTGGELDSSDEVRRLGLALLGAPVKKRLALSVLSLKLASLRATTDSLHACLLGGWTHAMMYRRQFMSILSKSYAVFPLSEIDKDNPKIYSLSRSVAEELVVLSVLAPLITTDLSAVLDSVIYATDASDAKGAFVSRSTRPEVARSLWRTGKKKTGFVRMLRREEALIRKLDIDKEDHEWESPACAVISPEKPRAHRFHFIEVCGGSGKVSRAMSERGWTVGPVLDIGKSPFYNLRSLKLLSWILHLVQEGLLDSLMVEPPCTTFSPAQYPASRSYQNPRGHDPTDPKTLEGTELALRALTLIWFCIRGGIPALLEQPRRTKMKFLSEWKFLLDHGAFEVWLASCAYGSPHLKEFVLLSTFAEAAGLHRPCPKNHVHVKIEGVFTKPSAIYTDSLAESIAHAFDLALKKKLRLEKWNEPAVLGLESPLCNDLLLSGKWKEVKSWNWKSPAHINILESSAACRLFKDLALKKPKTREVVIMDSHVAMSALVKGRSPSHGLRPSTRRAGATCVVGSLYPAFHFGPTRWNTADCPTRNHEFPAPCLAFSDCLESFEDLMDFASIDSLKRSAANWIRLVTLVLGIALAWKRPDSGWRFAQWKFKHFPFTDRKQITGKLFDRTLGFPGEGPGFLPHLAFFLGFFPFVCHWILHALPLCDLFVGFWIFLSHLPPLFLASLPLGLAFGFSSSRSGRTFLCKGYKPRWYFPFVVWILVRPCHGIGAAPTLVPRDSGDIKRATLRAAGEDLPKGRPVLGQTQAYRNRLLSQFDDWLKKEGISLNELLDVHNPDIDCINTLLEKYGRALYKAGRPYNFYVEKVSARRPRIRRSLQQAWDVAYAWLRKEPPIHHTALPWQALLAILSIALSWGWTREAGVISLSWGGITRIGEVFAACRGNLVLPDDIGGTCDFALLEIHEPKARFTTARHQAARLDHPQLLKVLQIAFGRLHKSQKLWPFSPQTMRLRFQRLLEAANLAQLPDGLSRGIDLGSLRAGGASWLLLTSEDSELTRRRGRWLNNRTIEIYIQEITALQFLPRLPPDIKQKILTGASLFPWCLQKAAWLFSTFVPETAWYLLFKNEAVVHTPQAERDGWKKTGDFSDAWPDKRGLVQLVPSMEQKGSFSTA